MRARPPIRRSRRPRTWFTGAGTVLAVAAALVSTGATGASAATGPAGSYDPQDPAQKAAHDAAYQLGLDAYEYGLPLLDVDRLTRTYRSVNVCDEVTAYGPENTLCHARRLMDARYRDVVAPNSDTNYSMATLHLPANGQPMVVTIPETPGRYHNFAILDMYTNDVAVIGDAVSQNYPDPAARPFAHPDGTYVIVGPGQHVSRGQTHGLPVIQVPTEDVWLLGRTLLKSPDDLPAVHAVQDSYRLVPLNKYGKDWSPAPPKQVDSTVDTAHIPGTAAGEDPIAFFDTLGDLLAQYPPPGADAPMLERMASVGIGAGEHPSSTQSAATLAGLRDAVKAGPARIDDDVRQVLASGFAPHNGWLVGDFGSYGTDYRTRAMVAKVGLGALDSRVATYPFTQTDRTGKPLTGATRYVAHFAPGTFPPPVDGFWSLSLYDANMFFVPNEIDRYVINDRTDLHRNPDGSVDIYIQPDRPSDPEQAKNWLPSPVAGDATNPTQRFTLITRLYGIRPADFPGVMSGAGWVPPTVLACGSGGSTAAGQACAS